MPESPTLTQDADGISLVEVIALGVGHGDATLLRVSGQGAPYVCLIDGGGSGQNLADGLKRHNVDHLNLLIATHFDTDHVGGLVGLTSVCRVDEYWGPALDAYRRHLWLFGTRGAEAITRGERLEAELTRAGTTILYPVEGFTSAPLGSNDFVITILSPAARLVQTLLAADAIDFLVTQVPTPLGWLQRSAPADAGDDAPRMAEIERLLERGYLTPADVADLRIVDSRRRDDVEHLRAGDLEYFGNPLLNNTSIVTWIQARTASRTHRLIFPGDQENWTYLLYRNPRGLQAEIVKAAHHGGEVSIESENAEEEVLATIRPKVVMMSANGRHKLPHASVRTAARRWGATVFCTSQRQDEFVDGMEPPEVSCHKQHGCSKDTRDVLLKLSSQGIYGTNPACVSGLGGDPTPVITIQQHVIDPSGITSRLFHRELKTHISWLAEFLRAIHVSRKPAPAQSALRQRRETAAAASPAVPEDHILTAARAGKRFPVAANLRQILEEGNRQEEFWARQADGNRNVWHAYIWPSRSELARIVGALRRFSLVLFPLPDNAERLDLATLLNAASKPLLGSWADEGFCFPAVMFRDAIWPAVFEELSTWQAAIHPWGVLGFSRKSTFDTYQRLIADTLLRGPVEPIESSGYGSDRTNGIDLDGPAAREKILVSDKWSSRSYQVPFYRSEPTLSRVWFCLPDSEGRRPDLHGSSSRSEWDASRFGESVNPEALARLLDGQLVRQTWRPASLPFAPA